MAMKLKLKVIAGAGALVWMSAVSPVLAADIPAAPIVKAPVMAPVQSWYGTYIGLHGGYGWGRQGIELVPDAAYLPLFVLAGIPTVQANDPKGFVGGITYGSNWQFGRVVLGTDSDFSFTDIKSTQAFAGAVGALPFTANAEQKLKWLSTSRLRGGILATDNMLLYVTGGLATGRVSSLGLATTPGCLIPGSCPAGGIEKTKWGWAGGGGVEFANGPWQFRAEYLHYDLGTVNYLISDPTLPGAAIFASNKFSGDIVRGAITYRFNWTLLGLITGSDRM
jgi:outer membrane immunogenic protein